MLKSAASLALACATLLALPITALAASDVSTLPPGRYGCWTAGAAVGPAVIDLPERSFEIVRGSSYESAKGGGAYLLAGDLLTFTRGPMEGMQLKRTAEGLWQQVSPAGALQPVKCNRVDSPTPRRASGGGGASGAPAADRG